MKAANVQPMTIMPIAQRDEVAGGLSQEQLQEIHNKAVDEYEQDIKSYKFSGTSGTFCVCASRAPVTLLFFASVAVCALASYYFITSGGSFGGITFIIVGSVIFVVGIFVGVASDIIGTKMVRAKVITPAAYAKGRLISSCPVCIPFLLLGLATDPAKAQKAIRIANIERKLRNEMAPPVQQMEMGMMPMMMMPVPGGDAGQMQAMPMSTGAAVQMQAMPVPTGGAGQPISAFPTGPTAPPATGYWGKN